MRAGFAAGTGILLLSTFLGKALGLLREVIVAAQHGAALRTDLFYAAQSVPLLLAAALGTGLGTALVPVSSAFRARGMDCGGLYAGFVLQSGLCSGALGFSILAAAPFLAPLLMPALTLSAGEETLSALRWMGLLAAGISLQYALAGLFHAEKRFGIPALAALVDSGAVVATLLAARRAGLRDPLSVAWTTGACAGGALLMVASLPLIARRRPAWSGDVLRASGPIALASLFGSAHLVVDRLFGASLSEGAAAGLAYAFVVASMPVVLIGAPIANAALPYFSDLAAAGRQRSLSDVLPPALRLVCLVFVPMAVFTAVQAEPLVRLMYGRGAFGPEDIALTARALRGYSFSILPLGLILLLSRALYANGRRAPVLAALGAGAAAKLLLSLVLIRPLAEGGLSIATSVGTALTAGVLWAILRPAGNRAVATAILAAGAASALGLAAVEGLHRLLPLPIVLQGAVFVAVCGGILWAAFGRRRLP